MDWEVCRQEAFEGSNDGLSMVEAAVLVLDDHYEFAACQGTDFQRDQ